MKKLAIAILAHPIWTGVGVIIATILGICAIPDKVDHGSRSTELHDAPLAQNSEELLQKYIERTIAKMDSSDETSNKNKFLNDKVVGTIWNYSWDTGYVEFGFHPSGSLTLVDAWEGSTWRVISSTEIVLQWKANGRLALLTFDTNLDSFRSSGWDGLEAIGMPTGRRINK